MNHPHDTTGRNSRPDEVAPQEILQVLKRRKLVVIQTFAVIVAVGILITFVTRPVYRSMTRVLVEGKSLTLSQVNANDPLSNLFLPPAGYDVGTQIEVLQSEKVLDETYKAAGIPLRFASGKKDRSVNLKVKQIGDTNVIEITADSTEPAYAEGMTKMLPATYLKYITGNRKVEVTSALQFAQKRLKEEEAKLNKAELALESFRNRVRLIDLQAERTNQLQQSSAVAADVRKAEAAVSGSRARLNSLIAERNALPASLETPTTTTNNVQIDAQKDRIAVLQAERAKLLVLFKPDSAELDKVDAQIAAMEARLAQLAPTVTSVSRAPNPTVVVYNEKIVEARATLTSAEAELADVKAAEGSMNQGAGKYSAIERRQAKLQRTLERSANTVSMLAKSVEDLSLREKATHDPGLVITAAQKAEKVAPSLRNNLILSVLLGLVAGIGFAFLQDFLDDRINAPEDARQILGTPSLGYVPLLKNQETRLIASQRRGSLLESFRVMRSNVQFATVDGAVRTIQVTSTNPGEGKSTTALNLAIAMALDGRDVILVDADLRRPTIHEKLGITQQPGLTNILLGRVSLTEALRDTDTPGLRILTTGHLPPNPAELLNSSSMRQLIEDLKGHADIVIFDTPPCLATADAQVMSAIVDGVLYVVHLGETKRTALRHAREMLHQAHARVLGMVFNKIDTSANSPSYYGYDSYYSRGGNAYLSDGKETSADVVEDTRALVRKNGKRDVPVETAPAVASADFEEKN